MVRLQGTDTSSWKCSGLQTNLYDHALTNFVDADMRAKLNVGRLRKGGSAYTPSQSTYRASDFRERNGRRFAW
jgi:penicillin G amidase